MLVLTRKVGEKLHIGDNIIVTITQVKGNRVKIGIEAPDNVRIVRGELEAISREFEIELPAEEPAPSRGLPTSNRHTTWLAASSATVSG